MTASPGEGLLRLLVAFDRLEIPYMIGGSGASSVHGITRTTGDIDMVAKIREHDVQPLASELQPDFYVDEEQIRAAVEHSRCFNLIHLHTGFKFAIFRLTADRYQQAQFEGRGHEKSSVLTDEPAEITISSPK